MFGDLAVDAEQHRILLYGEISAADLTLHRLHFTFETYFTPDTLFSSPLCPQYTDPL